MAKLRLARSTPVAPAPRPEPSSLQVVVYPDPVLRRRASEVTHFDGWLEEITQRMIALMVEQKGVGLAAPQVGLSLRFFVASPTGEAQDALALINPVIETSGSLIVMEEGCLSLPEIRAKISRSSRVTLAAQDTRGQHFTMELEDFPARIIQHEFDHLEGVLILDRMSPMARMANRAKLKLKGNDK